MSFYFPDESVHKCLYLYKYVLKKKSTHLRGPPVLSARGDVSDDTGVALLAHVDAVDLDDALARVETRHGRHCAWRGDRVERHG